MQKNYFASFILIYFCVLQFCLRENRKLLLVQKSPKKKKFDVVPFCNQFHQHFMNSFCANILWPKKIQSQTIIIEKMNRTLLYKKSTRKMLMKLTPGHSTWPSLETKKNCLVFVSGVNFINILRTHFLYESAFFCQNVTRKKLPKRLSYEKCVCRKKLPKRLSYEKCVCKTLMKLTARILFLWTDPFDKAHWEKLSYIINSAEIDETITRHRLPGIHNYDLNSRLSLFSLDHFS